MQALFEKSKEVEAGQNIDKDISIFKNPQLFLFHMLKIVSHYFQGQFEPMASDEILVHFLDAWDCVITGWYYHDV